MAKILTTAIVADIRNKLNGSVFSKNRYGGYVRTKVTPVNPQTTYQQAARNSLSTWSQNWRGLTESQRQSWISGAPNFPFTDIYGNTKILSGQALYVKLNINLQLIAQSPITTCPSPVAIPALESISLAADVSSQNVVITYAPDPVPADFSLVFTLTPMITPGISFVKNRFRTIAVAASASVSPATLTTEYTGRLGAVVLGQKVFVRAFYISELTGQAGIPVQAQTIAVA